MKRLTLLFTTIILLSLTSNIFAQSIPQTINYQGVLKDAAGVLVPNGDYNLTFKLYNVQTGGTSLWNETKAINVVGGIVNTQLGSVTPIPSATFVEAIWLGITVAAGIELTPRIALSSVPYSFMSMNVPDGSITATKIATGEVVKSLNGLKDNVNIAAGSNVAITPIGNTLTISSTGGGGGTVTQINTGAGLIGGPIMTSGMISIPNDGISDVMLQNNSVTSSKITDGTINAVDIGNSQVLKSLNTLKDNVTLVAGSNISISPSGQNLTIASTSSGMGGSGTANYIPIFTSGTTLGNSFISQNSVGIDITSTSASNINPTLTLSRTGSNSATSIRFSNSLGNNFDVGMRSDGGFGISSINNNVGVSDVFVIKNSKAGIGTITPLYPLHVESPTAQRVMSGEYTGTTEFDGYGVYGKSTPIDGYGYGGFFQGGYRGVYAAALGGDYTGIVYGVYGMSSGGSVGTRVGVYGYGLGGATTWAGYFAGNVNITGTISKGGGSFKIDHPLDPTNKNLYHSFVESPDMMNIYNGNVVTDATGYATITMPDWFEALNQDFRYQLTVIGDFAQAIIAQKIQNNQFVVRTDKPSIEVSWQVTGIRHDKFAEKHRIPVEENKRPEDVGKYLHPDAYGVSETMGVDYENNQTHEQRK